MFWFPADATMIVPRWFAMLQAAQEKEACHYNLNQIALALESYQTKYKAYPPPVVFDQQGRPMHSWRVLILPWLEQKAIYDQYRFDEPWDGPNNRKLHDLIVSPYACPSHPGRRDSTSYVTVVGADAALQPLASVTVTL